MTTRDAWLRARVAIGIGLAITLPVSWFNVSGGRALPAFCTGVSVGALLMALLACWMVSRLGAR